MKKHRHHWIAAGLSGFALVLFLAGCEAKKSEPVSQAPEDQSQSMAREPEKSEGAAVPTPESEKVRSKAGKEQSKSGRPG